MGPRWQRGRSALLLGTALQAGVLGAWSLAARSQPAPTARPTGGVVSAGSAGISYSAPAATTTISQSSQSAVINWRSFNVGAQQSVNFKQPSASATALNRVRSPNPSQIAGKIDANGQVVLINQSGVIFYKGAQVNTAGLIVSAAGMSNANFMAGKMVFDRRARPNAAIVNQGTLTVKQAGLAALVAPRVVNSGVIDAKLGHVVLAGAKTATLDLYGDGLVSLDVSNEVTRAPLGRDGRPVSALVTNSGVIRADGGTVQLTAREASGLVHSLVEAGGTITAPSVGAHTGTIVLDGVGGSVVLTGAALAQGNAPGTTGGSVQIDSSADVTLASGSRVSVSGRAGGGTVAIGTTLARAKGGPGTVSALTAQNVTVAQGARVTANATGKGNGGRITLLSGQSTNMAGIITARGGPQGGDGGFVEVSGGVLALSGHIDASAPNGTTGTLLLDPADLWVSDVEPEGLFTVVASELPTIGANQAPNATTVSWVSPTLLAAQNANISLAATNDLFLASSFVPGAVVTNTLNLGTHTLSLTAGSNLTIDRGFTIDAGSISLTATTGSITLGGSSGVGEGLITQQELTALNPTNLQVPGGNITMSAGTGITLADATLGASGASIGTLDLSTTVSGGVTQAAQGGIFANILQSSRGVVGGISLIGTGNSIKSLGNITATSFALTDNTALSVTGVVNGGTTIALTAPSINITGGEITDGGAGNTTLTAYIGGITENGGTVIAGTLSGSSSGSVSLNSSNTIGALGSFTAGVSINSGQFALTDASALTVNGPVNASGGVYLRSEAAAGITVGGNIASDSGSGTVGLQTDALSITDGGSVRAFTFELAPNTSGNGVTLGATGSGLSLLSLAGINASELRIGAVTEPGNTLPTTTAGSIDIAGAFGNSNVFFIELDATGNVTVAPGASVTAFDLDFNATGNVTVAPGASVTAVDLDFNATGNVTEATNASVLADFLTGTAASFSLPSSTNGIGEIDTLTANTGNIAIVDNPSLTPVSDPSALVLTGTQSAQNLFYEVALVGGTIQLGGSNADGAPIPGILTAAAGRVSLVADNITAPITGDAINAPSGRVELAPFSPINTSLLGTSTTSLVISSELLSIIAPTGTLAIGGFTNAPAGATAPTPSASSVSIDSPINLTGIATTLDLLANGTVTQPGGSVTVNTLIGDASSATLSDTGNDINTLGAFTATTSGITLADDGNNGTLSVTGPVSAATNVALSTGTTGGISASGAIDAGTNLAIVTGSGGIGMASGGGLTGTTVDLSSTGGINEVTGATITAGTLQSSGGVSGGAVTLAGASNAIAGLGNFTVSGNTFSLSDTGPLSVDGVVSASGVTIGGAAGSTPSGLTMLSTGSIVAPTIALSAGGSGIAVDSGAVVGETDASIDLASAGGISENVGARIVAATLASLDSITGGAVTLAGADNAIGDLGDFIVAGNGFSLSDLGFLDISGLLSASSITIGGNAGSTPTGITLTGAGSIAGSSVTLTAGGSGISISNGASLGQAGGTVGLTTTGAVTEDGRGAVNAGTLSVAANTVSLPGASNAVSALGNSTATTFSLYDSTDLLIAAKLNAADISLLAPNNQISLGNGATIVTGGVTPPIRAPINPAEEPSNGAPGAFIEAARFSQIGSSTLAGLGGGPATLEISISKSASFDPPLGLFAPNGWLILNLRNGTATGDVFVNALNVTHTVPGGATLAGTIDGVAGPTASIFGANQPTIDPAYTFNGCEIGAGCLVATGPLYAALVDPLPPFATLTQLALLSYPLAPAGGEGLTDPDVVPPNISYVDY